jgi:hypothetical protein
MTSPREKLDEANVAIAMAVQILTAVRPTLEEFMVEAERMDSFGPLLAPSLFRSPERVAVQAILKPIYRAALDFVRAHEITRAAAADALSKVRS